MDRPKNSPYLRPAEKDPFEHLRKLDERLKPIIERGRNHLQARYGQTFTFLEIHTGNQNGDIWLVLQIDHNYDWGRFDLRTFMSKVEPEGAIEALVDKCADVYDMAYGR